jgi:O-antigen/teichoic acid export membrane protein
MRRPPAGASGAQTTSLWERVRQVVGRLSWGVADQALSSLTNFGIGICVARWLGPTEFGAFSLAFVTYFVALNATRGLATDPLLVRYSGAERAAWRPAVRAATGTVIVVGLVLGAGSITVGMLLSGELRLAFIALGMVLPGLLLQDSWRYALFAAGRGASAFLNDLVWALALIPALAAAVVTGHADVFWLTLAWGGSALLAAVVGAVQTRLLPRPLAMATWLREHHHLALRYLGENVTESGAAQLRMYGVSAIAGLAAVGSIRAAELLLGPFNVVVMGITNLAVPEAVQLLRRSTRQLRSFCLAIGGGQAAAALVVGMTMLALPGRLGSQLLGPSWESAHRLLLPVTLTAANTGLSAAAITGLRALGAASMSLRARLVAAGAALAGGLVGAVLGGALGAAWGVFAGTVVGAVTWWWHLHAELGRRERSLEQASQAELSSLS